MHEIEEFMISANRDDGILQRLSEESRLEEICKKTFERYGFVPGK